MKELVQLQNQFQEYLLHMNTAMENNILGTAKVSAKERLAIYKNAYNSRLLEALESTYSMLSKHLGEESFEVLANSYIHHRPSTYRSIRWFGDQLDLHLNEHSHFKLFPYLSELAKFEWTMALVFDAANAEIISLEDVVKIPPNLWENMRFKLHPSTHFLYLKWNVVAIWQSLSADEVPVMPEESVTPVCWIAWRKEFISQFCSLPTDEAWALNAIKSGKTFGEICEGLCEWIKEEEAPLHAASLLKGWITAEIISQVYITKL